MGFLYILGGLPIGFFLIQAENQTPWMIALAVYFVAYAILGNWYVFFGGNDATDAEGNIRFSRFERLIHGFFIYGGAILFVGLSVQLLAKGFVLGLGIGASYFPDMSLSYESLSQPRLLSWIISGIVLLLAGIALFFRSRRAVLLIGIGTMAFVLGAAHDYYLLKPGNYEPNAGQDLFVMGTALLIWFAGIVGLRFRGALR